MNEHPHGDCMPHGHPHPPGAEDIDGVDPLSSSVMSSFRRMMHLNRQFLLRASGAEKGGGFGRANVLRVLAGHEGISQRELAQFLHLSPPTVTTMLQKMEQDGLIQRWGDETDQRVTRIRLTEQGHERSDGLKVAYAQYVRATIGSMSGTDREELARLLEILADNTAVALKKLDGPTD
jgi:DNA-binding MarR family transcriptional regulator